MRWAMPVRMRNLIIGRGMGMDESFHPAINILVRRSAVIEGPILLRQSKSGKAGRFDQVREIVGACSVMSVGLRASTFCSLRIALYFSSLARGAGMRSWRAISSML